MNHGLRVTCQSPVWVSPLVLTLVSNVPAMRSPVAVPMNVVTTSQLQLGSVYGAVAHQIGMRPNVTITRALSPVSMTLTSRRQPTSNGALRVSRPIESLAETGS